MREPPGLAPVTTSSGRVTPVGEVTRRAALEGFMNLFEPGNIVDLACGAGPARRSG